MGEESWELCNGKDCLIIGVDANAWFDQASPEVQPSPEIQVEEDFYQLKAIVCYDDHGTDPANGQRIGHYYTILSKLSLYFLPNSYNTFSLLQ